MKILMVHMDKAEGSHYRDKLLAKISETAANQTTTTSPTSSGKLDMTYWKS